MCSCYITVDKITKHYIYAFKKRIIPYIVFLDYRASEFGFKKPKLQSFIY